MSGEPDFDVLGVAGADDDVPAGLDALRKRVENAGGDKVTVAVRLIEAMARGGMDNATRLAVRAWVKTEKLIPLAEFDALAARARRAPPSSPATRAAEPARPCTLAEAAAVIPETPKVPVPGDPAGLLHELHRWLTGYVAFPSAHAAVAVTLWIVHTHLAACFDSTGRLALLSPEPECGKTRVLELAEAACAGAELLNDTSAAYLFRRIGAGPVTLLIDEGDAIWKRGKADESAEAIRSIINAGHRKGATVGRVEMNSNGANLVRFPVYAPAAIAAKGDPLPDTIMSRALVIRMRRRAPGHELRRYRERITRPEGDALRAKLAAWAGSVAGKVGDPWPELPGGLDDRPADVWEPLLAVAELAGGDWPALARDACAALIGGARNDAQTDGTRLLADLRDVFGDRDALWTETILNKLCALDEAPWGNWDEWHGRPLAARDLARLLGQYTTADGKPVRSRDVRIGDVNRKGYRREDLRDAWHRYLPAPSATGATSATSQVSDVADASREPLQGATPLIDVAAGSASENPSATGLTSAVADVADVAHTPVGGTEREVGAGASPPPAAMCAVCREPVDPARITAHLADSPDCDTREPEI